MPHIHWVERQNKLEISKEKDEVNKREVHECDVRTRDPDAMVDPCPKRIKNILSFFYYYFPVPCGLRKDQISWNNDCGTVWKPGL